MNCMVLGSGGREHALAWKLAQSPLVEMLYVAPGNPGTAQLKTACGPRVQNIALSVHDTEGIIRALKQYAIHLLVIGPEDPLVNGLHDACRKDKQLDALVIVGPDARGAQLEGSKDVAKRFMARYGIPTAAYQTFTSSQYAQACAFLEQMAPPYVLKADGLAAGKGVLIPTTLEEAKTQLKEMMGGKFGEAGDKVVIEQFLDGIEVSVFVLTDGVHFALLPEAKDYKRIGDGNTGLNTGGMGAVSPVVFADSAFMEKVKTRIIAPTLAGLAQEQIDYRGFIFFGLMNVAGDPYVIEYNVRMGDPETEAVMMRLEGDFARACYSLGAQTLHLAPLGCAPQAAVTVVGVSAGYPEAYAKGKEISMPEAAVASDSVVFHMGTALRDGTLVTSGGRVLAASSVAPTVDQAREAAYRTMAQVTFEGLNYRSDIGQDLLAYGHEGID